MRGLMRYWGVNPWLILACCIVAEVIGTSLLTKSAGFTRPAYGIAALVIFVGCFWGLSQVLTRIQVGTVYAVWAGMGIALIALIGWLFLRQPLTGLQAFFIALILVGTVGLYLGGPSSN